MTVHELITQLNDCDQPDSEIRIRCFASDGTKFDATVSDVYYASLTAKQVTLDIEQVQDGQNSEAKLFNEIGVGILGSKRGF